MRGEFIWVWSETWREIWIPLVEQPIREGGDGVPDDIFCDLYRELAKALRAELSMGQLADTIDNADLSREAFAGIGSEQLSCEQALVGFFESVHGTLEEYEDAGDDTLTNRYFTLIEAFIEKYNLRYDLRRPFVLCPTLPGMFASLLRDLRTLTGQDAHLDQLMKEYEDAVRDLRFGCTDGRIKTCIGKQFMLLEAIGAVNSSVTKNTLGDMCDQVTSWPHATIKESLKKLYGFASDYPGIRHGTRAKGALRAINMRDMLAMSILLAGFTPYLECRLSAEAIYGAGTHASPARRPVAAAANGTAHGYGQRRGFFGGLFDRLLGRSS